MRITECTRQQAGECADALRELMVVAEVDVMDAEGEFRTMTGFDCLTVRQQQYLRDLLSALEDAERGTPKNTEVTTRG